jgi:transposase
MLAEGADYVVGVDTHADKHAFALVETKTALLLESFELPASAQGYRQALSRVQRLAQGKRLWALEGSGCYGAGLARFLIERKESVREVARPLRRGMEGRLKSDSLDAYRAARAALERPSERPLASPRASGMREALRVMLTTREQVVEVRRAGLNQLRGLLVTTPDPLRRRLSVLSPKRLPAQCQALRLRTGASEEERAVVLSLRLLGRRVMVANREAGLLQAEIERCVRSLAPALLAEPGVGPISAGFLICAWSHKGRLRSEAAFARLAGCAPIPASSGKFIRHRLDHGGDRKLNRALYTIVLARRRSHEATIAYIERRIKEGKSSREAVRCLKRYVARRLFRLLESGAILA